MGHRMVRHLARTGHRLIVADATTCKLAPEGAAIATGNGDVGSSARIVVLSLPNGAASDSVCRQLIGAKQRLVDMVIDTSTIGIKAAREVAARLGEHGIDYVDAPVSGGVAGADAASLSIIVACTKVQLERASPILSCLGRRLFHVGDRPGMGQAVKLLNNFLSATAMAATSEAVAFGVAEGLDMKTILEVVNRSTGQNTASLDKFPKRILTESYDGGFAAAMMAKDVRLYLEEVTANGTAARLARQIDRLWSAFDRCEPGADFTRIYPFVSSDNRKV